MKNLDLIEIFTKSFNLLKDNFSSIAYLILGLLLLSTLGIWFNTDAPNPLYLLINVVISIFINYALVKTILRLVNHQAVEFKDLNLNISELLKYLAIDLLYGLLVIGGLILLIVPGIYFAIKYFFAGLILLDKKQSIKASWNASAKLTQGRKLKLLPILLINMLAIGLTEAFVSRFVSPYLSSLISIFWQILFLAVTVEIYHKFEAKKR